jgi:hypothetical protein
MSELKAAYVVYTMLSMNGGQVRTFGPRLLTEREPDTVPQAVNLILSGRAAEVEQSDVATVRERVMRDVGLE